ncbi:MAG: hypothetical protein MUQ27_03225, partial [Acidimicrobiia bacterium]|nr:hypothetical protein [Acidimicrobiia bacterium]
GVPEEDPSIGCLGRDALCSPVAGLVCCWRDSDLQPHGVGPGGGLSGGGVQSNVLVDRFLANPEFAALYDQALADLAAALYESGSASDVLATWVSVLAASDLVDANTIAVEAAAIAAYFA